jgi:hypothetical protein
MMVAAGSNFIAQEHLTRSMVELLGGFNKHASRLVKRIIQELPRQQKSIYPLTKLD